MTTLLFTHPSARDHHTPLGHPEQVGRIDAVLSVLNQLVRDHSELHGHAAEWRTCPEGDVADVLRCHPQRYIDRILAALPTEGEVMLDSDTFLSAGSYEAAMRAVGGACAAVDSVLKKEGTNAFVAMRPPGHHAETETAMGFCVFGNAAIAAKRALDHHMLDRVAVLDFDVHHGNGTQDLLWNESRCFFASTHQMPLYPGTGSPADTGAHGQIMNVRLSPGSDGARAREVWKSVLGHARDHAPQLVILSAGFDAHRDDPLAQLNWTEADFTAITRSICDMARDCHAPVVSLLEGGYNLGALGRSVRAHVEVLMEYAQ